MAEELKGAEEKEPGAGVAGFAGIGCTIALVMFVGLAIWTIYVGISQNREIAKFTEEERKTYPIDKPSAELIAEIETKLKILELAAEKKEETSIELSVDDMNALIATQQLLEDLRGNTRVARISEQRVDVRMSPPLRKLPFGRRYLNGMFRFVPEEIEDSWQFTLYEINADAGPVNPDFLEMFQELQLLRFNAELPKLKPVLKQLKSAKLADGKVVLTTWQGDPPEPEKDQ